MREVLADLPPQDDEPGAVNDVIGVIAELSPGRGRANAVLLAGASAS